MENTTQNRKINNFYRRRNTPTYSFMAWSAFILASGFEFIGIYNLKQPLSVQGYYAVTGVLLIITSFLLQKVARDNDEDKYLKEHNSSYRSRNTSAFTFMAWGGFLLAILAEYIGLYTLQEPFYVKGYYAIGGAFLIVACLVLQKTIRDNEEDSLFLKETEE
ncbi:hypothetical protein Back11_54930 [Paenibacillus baekrokdamisoli]|uniref:Uncharacterized protein n=2 Tax=Paenibacillus baekrokdamisoli TaxID=1712516 RepID=A0A3G9JJ90_9BACL|nr:hypothetical protein [Paenibacillus baekrokdamisoli]BBH24148.1 hypothetical protein Back11_54930 [Paenibacillus baekrokdamisoli]